MLVNMLQQVMAIRAIEPLTSIGVLLLTDSQSTLSLLATGPSRSGDLGPQCWKSLQELSVQTHRVHAAFMFAHCDDELGDLVDEQAKEAAKLVENGTLRPAARAWHTDVARPIRQRIRWEAERDALEQNELRRYAREQVGGLRRVPGIGSPPPTGLTVMQSRNIMQMRTGVWTRFPKEVNACGVGVEEGGKCKLCEARMYRSGAVAHMFQCPSTAQATSRPLLADIFSDDVATLKKCFSYCLQFIDLAVPTPQPTPETGTQH